MSESINFDIKFNVVDGKINAVINNISGGFDKINGSTFKMQQQFDKSLDAINKKLETISLSSILDQVDRVSQGLNNLAQPGVKYTSALADLSAITGQTGKNLENLGAMARENAKEFGGDASKSVETYKLLLSQLGPELAKTPELLNEMARSAEIMAKTMGGDTVGATQVLTTAMNQYGVDVKNPIEATAQLKDMMNAMAAAAKEGSSELVNQKSALNEVGGDAKRSAVKFNELLSAIQFLDKGGLKDSKGGIALRNIMTSLNQGRFLPKDVQKELQAAGVDINSLSDKSLSFTDRLRALQSISSDSALMTKLFGRESQGAAQILINSVDAQEKMTTAITGTSTAVDQAQTIMESPAEAMARQKARSEDLKVSLFNMTNGWLGYAAVLGDSSRDVLNIIPLFTGLSSVISIVTSKEKLQAIWTNISNAAAKAKAIGVALVSGATWLWVAAQWALTSALWASPVTWIIVGIIALIAIITFLVMKIDGWEELWDTLTGSFVLGWLWFEDIFLSGIETAKMAWYALKSLWDEEGAKKEILTIQKQSEERRKAIDDQKSKVAASGMEYLEKTAAAATSLSFNDQSLEDVKDDLQAKLGLDENPADEINGISGVDGIAGTEQGSVPNIPGGSSGSAADSGKKTNQAIATGGTKQVNITFNLKSMVESINIKGRDFKESAKQMEEQASDALLRSLAMANLTAG